MESRTSAIRRLFRDQKLPGNPRLRTDALVVLAVILALAVMMLFHVLSEELLLLSILCTVVFLHVQTQQSLREREASLITLKRELIQHFEGVQDSAPPPVAEAYRRRFLVKQGQRWLVVAVHDIAWFSADGKICFARTWDNRRFVMDYTMEELCKMVDPDDFFRVNRGYLVHAGAVKAVAPYFGGKLLLHVQPAPEGDVVVVSKEKAREVKMWLGK